MEHRLAEKQPPEADTIQTAHQRVALVALDGVGVAQLVQANIGRLHFPGYPGGLSIAAGFAALTNHSAKVSVNVDRKRVAGEAPAQAPADF